MSGLGTRALLFALGLVVATLVVSGAYSLWTRDSILNLGSGRAAYLRLGMLDEERQRMAAMTVGPYAVDPDPEVAMRMKGKRFDRISTGAGATADARGQRIRPGPEPHPDATRILLLGDSVIWSWGLGDDDTWDHQLEEMLAGAMSEGHPRPAVFSLACPGWNYRNAFRALLDDLPHYRPDVVVFVPVENDLDDPFVINEVGHREHGFDPEKGLARPSFGSEHYWRLMVSAHERLPALDLLGRALAGGRDAVEYVLLTGLTPTSQQAWGEMVARLDDVQRRLRHQGIRFASLLRVPDTNLLFYEHAVRSAVPDHPMPWLFDAFVPDDMIPGDGHPDVDYVRAAVRCLAQWLIEQGWVPGADTGALPELDPGYAARRFERWSDDRLREWHAEQTAKWARFLEPGVSFTGGQGIHQIYGGVAADGAVGRHFAVGLANPGARQLRLVLDRLPPRSGVEPLTLRTTFNGHAGEARAVPDAEAGEPLETTLVFPVPAAVRDAPYLDVQVDSSNWIAEVHEGKTRLVAYLLREVRLVE